MILGDKIKLFISRKKLHLIKKVVSLSKRQVKYLLLIHSISTIEVVLTSLTINVTMHVASFIKETKPGKLSKPFLSETSF